MFQYCKKYSLLLTTLVLLLATFYIFYLDFHSSPKSLKFVMLDIGQGDALFIESPTGTQVLVDGGPPKKVLSRLAQVMPAFDRSIDAIIITNPDQDHIGGFLDVLRVYKVGKVFEPGTYNDSKIYQSLQQEIRNRKIPNILAKSDMRLNLGGGAYIDILFPDRDVSLWERNDGSVVARLVYGETSVMLTGDATVKTEKIILAENSAQDLKSTILKVGHHGSRTSTSRAFAQAVAPTYALISAGKDNKYGHPHRETLDMLDKLGINVLRTDLLGTIAFSCDRMFLCEIKK
ncbi:MAG: MBL fold metallo-hydrolase [Candidatus Paceibacterota bacterium]|jgi:competence protein ComEC